MSAERRKFKHEPPDRRKLDLIEAALSLIAEKGVKGATVRDISRRAEVTQGLIRHYFSSKEDLIVAAYRYHMTQMTEVTYTSASQIDGTATERLAAFVQASLTPPVVSPRAVALWASFLVQLQQDANVKTTHEQTYTEFRDHLEDLIGAALKEAGCSVSQGRLRYLATACNAVIDGLWLEGGALPHAFAAGELPDIGLQSIGSIIAIDLRQKVDQA
ncbi:TetR family transcriptional regulator C-terminal domain-containing protein [Nitratireductor sp. XY-223]|uniref:TetR family transcriptional regulator C-terminal domain-containing protein n=1 Tax=Nitratireductor sp. XY-223 TaxID=2561926 RepID=UPI0010AA909F|nr:TetR family transcriptional regulator C-terminal domain-containing protein [Nitratireductor sp. XY-223]